MNTLFVHQNFPGQFHHLAVHLAADPNNHVVAICQPHAPRHPTIHNTIVYMPAHKPGRGTHHYVRIMEDGVLNSQAVANVLIKLRKACLNHDEVIDYGIIHVCCATIELMDIMYDQ